MTVLQGLYVRGSRPSYLERRHDIFMPAQPPEGRRDGLSTGLKGHNRTVTYLL
jgi:hypothetical protein